MSINKIQVLLLILIINSITFNSVYSSKCKHKEYECKDKKSCIPRSHICNGIKDCRDSSDENKCSTISSTILSTIVPSITHTSILDLFLGPMKGYIMGNSHKVYNHIGLLELCATLCIHTPSCKSINYIESYEQCHLNSQILGDIGVEFIGDSGSVYYSKIYSSTPSIKSISTSSSIPSSSTTSTLTSSFTSTLTSSTMSTLTSTLTYTLTSLTTRTASSTLTSLTTRTASSTLTSLTTRTASSTLTSLTNSINILPSTSLTVTSDKIVKQHKNLKNNSNKYTIYIIIPISIVTVIGVIVFVVIKRRHTSPDFKDRIVTNYNNSIYGPRPIHIVQSIDNISTDNVLTDNTSTDNVLTDNIYLTPYTNAFEMYEPIHNYEEINT